MQREIIWAGIAVLAALAFWCLPGQALAETPAESPELVAAAPKRPPVPVGPGAREWSLSLARSGDISGAIAAAQAWCSAAPEREDAWMLLGSLYQSSGATDRCLSVYKEYLRRFPSSDQCKTLRTIIQSLESEKARAALSQPAKPQFQAGSFRWQATRMPLRVFIESGLAIPWFHPGYQTILGKSFDEWSSASDGLISFVFTEDAGNADISCFWLPDRQDLHTSGAASETLLYASENSIGKATVHIAVPRAALGTASAVNQEKMHRICLYSVGRALGLTGVSVNPHDIMFSSIPYSRATPEISPADRQALQTLYSGGIISSR